MADALVAFFLQKVNLLLQETKTFSGLEDQILLLKTKLSDLEAQSPLFNSKLIEIGYFRSEGATQSTQVEELIKNWLVKVREIIYNADDCIDLFVIQFNSHGWCSLDQTSTIAKFRSELGRINERLDEILDNKSQLDISIVSIQGRKVKNKMKSASLSSGSGGDDEGENSMASFALKYSALPYYLKSCLRYCCTFRFSFICTEKLIRLLMAEGLIQEIPGERMEDVAKENINKLVELGMLQVLPRFRTIGVPELYHDFLLRVAEVESFFIFNASSDYNIPTTARHVLIKDVDEKIPPNLENLNIPIRSLFVLGIPYSPKAYENSFETMFCSLRFLRVLDLQCIKFKSMPEQVGNLILLRYLGLYNYCLVKLPNSIGSLQNLQTLSVCSFKMNALPSGILNLVQLRHLIMYGGPVGETKFPRGIGRLTNLQSLTGLYAGGGIANELSNLTQLRVLGVRGLSEDHASNLFASIMKLTRLLSLSLAAEESYNENSLLPSLETFSPPPLLQKLHLEGHLTELPDWLSSIGNLTYLSLHFSYLSENPTLVLQFLPNLKFLTLWEAYKTKHIGREFCRSDGFPHLEVLIICDDELVEWTELEEGALQSLKYLSFQNCDRLRTLPEGLQLVTKLKELEFFPLHGDLARKLSPIGGRENYKIKHIPVVRPKF